MSPSQVAARAGAQAPFWLSLLLAALIGYYVAKLAWLMLPGADTVAWQPPAAPSGPQAEANPTQSYRAIIDAHLFGVATAEAPPSGEAPLDAPDTSLSLQLRGAVATDDQKVAHAIIADGSGSEKVYFAGDNLPGGATLSRIEADRVVLSRGGQFEVLRLPRQSGGEAGSRSIRQAVQPMAATPGSDASVQELVSQNAGSFLDVVRPQPYMPKGELKGYRLYPGPNRQKFSVLGLRPGDLVTEINGIQLNNPTQGMEVFRSLSGKTAMTVTIERNGQPQVLSFNLADVTSPGGVAQ